MTFFIIKNINNFILKNNFLEINKMIDLASYYYWWKKRKEEEIPIKKNKKLKLKKINLEMKKRNNKRLHKNIRKNRKIRKQKNKKQK